MTEMVLPFDEDTLREMVTTVRRELMTQFVPPSSSLIRATMEKAWPYLIADLLDDIERAHPVTHDRDGNAFCEWCGVEAPCPTRAALGLCHETR